MSRRLARLLLVAGAAACVALASPVLPAEARDQGNIATMSPDNTSHSQSFGPVAGLYPIRTGAHPFAGFRPEACRTQTYCDAVEFTIEIPEGFREFFGVRVALSWPNHESNDLDLFVWPDDDPAQGAPMGPCSNPAATDCADIHPETFDLVEPDPGPIYMTVVNDGGVNTGYTINLEFYTFTVDPPTRPERPAPTFRPSVTTPRPEPDLFAAADDIAMPTPQPTPRTIIVPGPDGEPMEVELPVLASGNRQPPPPRGTNPAVAAGIAAAVVLPGGGAAYLIFRRRRAAAA